MHSFIGGGDEAPLAEVFLLIFDEISQKVFVFLLPFPNVEKTNSKTPDATTTAITAITTTLIVTLTILSFFRII